MIPQQEIQIGLVVSLVATLATEVIVFPLWSVDERLYPLLLGRANALNNSQWIKKLLLKGTNSKPCKVLLSAMKFSGSPTRMCDSYQFLGWHRVGTSVWHETTQQNNQHVQWFSLSWGMDSDNLHGIPRHLLSMLCRWNAFPRMRQDGHGECFWEFLAFIRMQFALQMLVGLVFALETLTAQNAAKYCQLTHLQHLIKSTVLLSRAQKSSPAMYVIGGAVNFFVAKLRQAS